MMFQATLIMDISIIMLDGTSHSLKVNPQDTVGSLKRHVQSKVGVSPERQKLMFDNGARIHLNDDSQTLSHYGLQSGSQLSLLLTQPTTIEVYVRNEKGQLSTYHIKPDETVSAFKEKVRCREGVQVSQQRLLHQSREMRDGKLSDYGVVNMSTIDMMLRLRGG